MGKTLVVRACAAFMAMSVVCAAPDWACAQTKFGPQGPEGAPNRRQDWLVPTQDQITASRAVLFRPDGKGPFRIAIIAHASTQNKIQRAQMPQPEYRTLAAALVARGFAVLVPERPGHGKTGGPYLEDQDGCDRPEYQLSGEATAESIDAALTFMRSQAFIRKDAAVIVGHSAGGLGALAMADHKGVAAVIVFAPGRGGRANNHPNEICATDRLLAAVAAFGENADAPVTWLVAENDTYFPPDFSRQMADTFRDAGDDEVTYQTLPPFGNEGHWLAESGSAAEIDAALDIALGSRPPAAASKR
ncbi:MAG: alpha/beta fold hydrolase [Bradyrhizobiaceae bacterium]|nr:MAG: alpha/beta fold hydrolase [Bradyrhizobiaceae bacterium]